MKSKKILAMALAVVMTFMTCFQTAPTVTVKAEDVVTNASGQQETTPSGSEETSSSIADGKFAPIGEQAKDEVGGVKSGEDAIPLENKTPVDEAEPSVSGEAQVSLGKATEIDRDSLSTDLLDKGTENSKYLDENSVSDDDMVRVIIVMEGDSIIEENSDAVLNFWTKLKSRNMERKQDYVVSRIEENVMNGESLDVKYQYTWLVNGIATEVPYGMIDEIEAVPGVAKVVLQPVYEVCVSDTYTNGDGVMIGREPAWANGYTGKGIKIAIIDTGIDEDHPSFAPLREDQLTADSASAATTSNVLTNLNAYKAYEGLTAEKTYLSTKIAYAFNYVDQSLVINHSRDEQGDHGTHVAGISAANDLGDGGVVGVAPEAQLFVMKVFGKNGGAFTEDIVAALEDALILGADVVNMSLGSSAGFTSSADWVNEVYERVGQTNTYLAVAAGNATTSGSGNLLGTDTNFASNPDNSVVSSPATYANATSVASVDNAGIYGYYIEVGANKYSYSDGLKNTNPALITLAGESYEYAMVDNCGQTAEDFAGVEGKIAVVSRGFTSFASKVELAQAAGAIACIVYNNTSGDFGMDLSSGGSITIPAVSISKSAGEFMAAALEADPSVKVFVPAEAGIVPSETAYRMSDFSSWGITPDLKLEPEVTAPGGNIYSTRDEGTYGLMSGTSMACPNVAGVAALVMQYAKEQYPDMSAADLHLFVNRLIMSTATPLMYDDEVPFSPRNQGAGLVNAYSSVTTSAYLTVDGLDMPKIELGDDVNKTGSYAYKFNVVNFGNVDNYYSVSTNVQTEDVIDYAGYKFMAIAPIALDAVTTWSAKDNMVKIFDYTEDGLFDTADAYKLYKAIAPDYKGNDLFRYDMTGDDDVNAADVQAYLDAIVGKPGASIDLTSEVFKVPAGSTAVVEVTIDVTDAGKAFMDENFVNGIYVEGFTVLDPISAGTVKLAIPYLAFYGDWTQAPIIDTGDFWLSSEEMMPSQYYNILWSTAGRSEWIPGTNPYFNVDVIDLNDVSLSPNGDGYVDTITDIYIALLRNAGDLSVTYKIGDEIFDSVSVGGVSKSYYSSAMGVCVPYVHSWYATAPDFSGLANGTKLELVVEAKVDYDAHESNNLRDTWTVPIAIDRTAPVLDMDNVVFTSENGRNYVTLTFADDVNVAGVHFLNSLGTTIYAQVLPETRATLDAPCTQTFDVTGFGNEFAVILGDFACNESAYILETENNYPILDENALYGYRIYDAKIFNDTLFGWLMIDPATGETTVLNSEYYMDYAWVSADSVGGYIVGCDANGDIIAIKPGDWDRRIKIASAGMQFREMTYDRTTGNMYAFRNGAIYTINILNGEVTRVTSDYGYMDTLVAMTATADGTIYGIDTNGRLRTINKEIGEWNEEVLLETQPITESYPYYAQALTYVESENAIYWTSFVSVAGYGNAGRLYKIDLNNNYNMTLCGTVAGDAEVIGLCTLDTKGFEFPVEPAQSLELKQESVTLKVGGTASLSATKTPWYSETGKLVWTSSDENVATVSKRGEVTGTGLGTATIYVTTEDGSVKTQCTVSVIDPVADLYAFVMGSENLSNQWVKFNTKDMAGLEVLTEASFTSYFAGEYFDGNVYTYSSAGELYRTNANTFESVKISGSNADYLIIDMAYNYADGFMYALLQDKMFGETSLGIVDVLTGNIEVVEYGFADPYRYSPCSLAIDTNGTMYVLSTSGMLYTYAAGEWTLVGHTGYSPSTYTQSMAYDHNNGGLYWAMLSVSNQFELMYIDVTNGNALSLGKIDGGAQAVSLYVVPENIPARDEVPVEALIPLTDRLALLQGSKVNIPVSVYPFNASDRNVEWVVENPEVVEVVDGLLYGKSIGETVLNGTKGDLTVSIPIVVIPSAGELRGYVILDIASYAGLFWGKFDDRDLSSGEAISGVTDYELNAAEYYDGKIYAYGVDPITYDSVYVVMDANNFEVLNVIPGNYPEILDMAFDYSTGTMYAVGGLRNVEGVSKLFAVNIATGQTYPVRNQLDDVIMAMACSTDGTLYGVSEFGSFYNIDKTTGDLNYIGETGYSANMYQSMAYDHNTGNIYWAQTGMDWMTWSLTGNLLVVNPEDASVINLGMVGTNGCQIIGLHTIPKQTPTIPVPEITDVILSAESKLLRPGATFDLAPVAMPLSVLLADVQMAFETSDANVATVDANGIVTAVGSGEADITVTCGSIVKTCKIIVCDQSKKIYAPNETGWEVAGLLYPETIDATVSFPAEAGFVPVTADYSSADGCFYAVDGEGYLWKYTEDLSVLAKVSDVPVTASIEVPENQTASVIDMSYNKFSGKCYVLVKVASEWSNGKAYIYELDVTNATLGESFGLSALSRPIEFVCISEDQFVVQDGYDDYIYIVDKNMPYMPETLVWAQEVFASRDYFGMAYSKEFNLIFISTLDSGFTGDGTVGYYILDPESGSLSKYSQTAFNMNLIDLIIVE